MKKLLFVLITLPLLFLVGLLMFATFGMAFILSALAGDDTVDVPSYESVGLSEKVLAYQPIVEQYAIEHGVEEYISIILAIMMQESGGEGTDPMQSSESLCGSVGCIGSPMESIEQGVKHFKNVLEKANGNILVAIQAYNYGTNFISWINERGGEYSLDLAIEYSREMYEKEKSKGRGHLYSCSIGEASSLGSCYGDYMYVQHVMRYTGGEYAGGFGSEYSGTGVWGNPLTIPMKVTSPFGYRIHPITGEYKMHTGVDFSCNKQNIPIKAVDYGIVVRAGSHGGYGNAVLIQHNDNLYSYYAHLHSIYTYPGQTVDNSTIIGLCGTTGSSTGIHLHLEARVSPDGGHINPAQFLQ